MWFAEVEREGASFVSPSTAALDCSGERFDFGLSFWDEKIFPEFPNTG